MAKKPEPTSEAVTAVTGKPPLPENLPRGYRIARRATAPLISISHEKELAFIVDGEIVEQDSAMSSTPGGRAMRVVAITRMDTGEEANLVVPTVMESALRRTPGGYVGKAFLVQHIGKRAGKRYNDIEVYELEDG